MHIEFDNFVCGAALSILVDEYLRFQGYKAISSSFSLIVSKYLEKLMSVSPNCGNTRVINCVGNEETIKVFVNFDNKRIFL